MEMPPVQEQVGIDVPIHLGATERGMTGITVESLLAVCGDVLEREGNVEAAAAVYAALAAASQRSGAEPEAQA
jgi:hypothetical protein